MSFSMHGCSMHIQVLYIWYVNCINIYISFCHKLYRTYFFLEFASAVFYFHFLILNIFVLLLYNMCEYGHTRYDMCEYQRTNFESEFPLSLGLLGSNSSDQANTVTCDVTH